MAEKQIEDSKRNKGPSGVVLVKTPYSGDDRLVLCSATSLPLRSGFALDRAANSVVVASPYIGALFLSNLKKMSVSSVKLDRDLATQLLPRVEPRLFSTMWSRLTRNNAPIRIVLAEDKVGIQAAAIKGKRGPYTKFVDALKASLEDAPLSFSADGSTPMLPVAYSISHGYNWSDILPLLHALQTRASHFEKLWGWHGKDIKKFASEIHERRKERREVPDYTLVQKDDNGNVVLEETFSSLLDAHEKATSIRDKKKTPGNSWVLELSGNLKNVTVMNSKTSLFQECRWHYGRSTVSIYRTIERLIDLIRDPTESCSSSSDNGLSDD